ncbi:MAG TPA: hypothetical protein VFM44_07120 [Gemmatimonadota bacterium]|nr:hypothetical protein [Gemmatimonadota bacterium]
MRYPKWIPILAFAAIAATSCENDPSLGVEGTYPITLTYTTDTCVGDVGRSEAVELTIERDGDNVAFTVGDAGTLTGTFDNENRVMTVDGTILVPNPSGGTFPGDMHMVARVTEGDINILGSITFEGTFPGVSGTCERAFQAGGRRDNLSVLPLTGP